MKRGLWTAEEDAKILAYVSSHGIGNWTLVPKKAGFLLCALLCFFLIFFGLKFLGFDLYEWCCGCVF